MRMQNKSFKASSDIDAAVQMVRILRDSHRGCPWLSTRSFENLFPYFLEELYEYKDAFQTQGVGSPEARQELADLLFQVILHTCLLEEQNPAITLDQLAKDLSQKLERRHPHVFDASHKKYASAEEAALAWEILKTREATLAKRSGELQESMADKISRIPKALPSLQRASRIGEKTQGFGFDWSNVQEVMAKVEEEFLELKAELETPTKEQSPQAITEELGDLLFSLAQLSRHLGHCPEEIGNRSNEKFIARFKKTESLALQKGLVWQKLSPSEKEALWTEAKNIAKNK